MDIKSINQTIGNNNRVNDSVGGQAKGSAGAKSEKASDASDKVTLTNASGLEAKAKAANVDNTQRISELKESIKDGSYEVNAEKVAQKLIQTETLFAQ